MSALTRTAALLASILLGLLVPQAHGFAWLIRWLIVAMLFIVFLQTRITWSALHRSHLWLLLANLILGFTAWGAGMLVGGRDVALAAFFAGITPTATAAPVIISFLRGRVDYVVAAFLLTNVAISLLLPFLLPVVLGQATPQVIGHVLGSVATVVFLPMVGGWLVRRLYPRAAEWPARLRMASFSMWVLALFLITSNASAFVRSQAETPLRTLLLIGGVSLVTCAINFAVGHVLGGREFHREASQSLGQKNTTFTIYLALTYASPLIALGPTFYVVWHNVWNSWQLHRAGKAHASMQRP
jgi:BASS family bile acid:Na+ symporter